MVRFRAVTSEAERLKLRGPPGDSIRRTSLSDGCPRTSRNSADRKRPTLPDEQLGCSCTALPCDESEESIAKMPDCSEASMPRLDMALWNWSMMAPIPVLGGIVKVTAPRKPAIGGGWPDRCTTTRSCGNCPGDPAEAL